MRATVALAGRTTVFSTDDVAGVEPEPETDVDDAQAAFRVGSPAVGAVGARAEGGDVEAPDPTDDGERTDETEWAVTEVAATEEAHDEVQDRLKGLGHL